MTNELLTTSLFDFFYQLVEDGLDLHQISPQPQTRDYIVNLLCDFMARPKHVLDKPLGVTLVKAPMAKAGQYVSQLREVGDQALYVASFFRERIERRELNVDYYSEVGGTAYRRLSDVLAQSAAAEDALADVYGELGAEFRQFVEVLAEVKQQTASGNCASVGDLYEAWLTTKSKTAQKQLAEAGILVADGKGSQCN